MMMMNGNGLMINPQQQQEQHQQLLMEAAATENMSNLTSASGDQASTVSSSSNIGSIYAPQHQQQQYFAPQQQQNQGQHLDGHSNHPPPPPPEPPLAKKKRSLPGNPDPDAEVIALSPKTLLATNRFVCEICNKGFQRDQNLQLHRRGHNLPWKLKQRSNKEVKKKVYVCPEPSCVHHDPSRALGDLTGVKKHFCRKHGEKKWKCDKCSKRYAVQSDYKAHSKTCGTREYRCDCGTLFSRRDSFITHRAFCDALAEETARAITTTPLLTPSHATAAAAGSNPFISNHHHLMNLQPPSPARFNIHPFTLKSEQQNFNVLPPWLSCPPPQHQPSMVASTPDGTGNAGPQQTIDHHHHISSSSPISIFNQEFIQTSHHDQQHQNPNPSHGPTISSSPAGANANTVSSYPSAPHLSATALLQKAAQMGATISNSKNHASLQKTAHMGATINDNNNNNNINNLDANNTAGGASTGLFGLNMSSRDDDQIVTTGSFFGTQSLPSATSTAAASSSSFLHDMMMNAVGFDQNPSFDDATFGSGAGGTGNDGAFDFHQTFFKTSGGQGGGADGGGSSDGGNVGGGGRNDGLTRDFLGLRPLSRNDILNFAGFGNCMSSSNATTTAAATASANNSHDNHDQQNKSWQG